MFQRKHWVIVLTLLVGAATFRVAVAHWLPNDAPGDGVVYAQMARNLLEQHVYSHEAQAPYDPSLIRLPGYPLFLAGVYSIFGQTNNGAVRLAQALIDTGTCALIALLAFYWQPDEKKKHASALAALALAAVCPFTAIYAATILAEVPTNFLVTAMMLAATLALRKQLTTEDTEEETAKERFRRSFVWWIVAGLIGGAAVLFRPDNGLFVAAVGLTLVIVGVWKLWSAPAERSGDGALDRSELPLQAARLKAELQNGGEEGVASQPSPQPVAQGDPKRRRRFALPAHSKLARTFIAGALFSLSFAIVLTPWTIRNWRVFHVFQPLSPAHAEMPGEFIPRGYGLWLRTWLDDDSYIAPLLWSLDTAPIDIDDVPPYAFDSAEEKNRVAALIDKYNHPDGEPAATANSPERKSPAAPPPSTSPSSPNRKASPSPKNSNANSEEENSEEGDEEESENEQQGAVEMTPEIDAAFAQIARERIARHRFQFYVWLPIKRARTMWFDTHSQYWPFEGTLLPFEDLDYELHQQIWLPLFAGLTALYSVLGLAGAWFLWTSGKLEARSWLLLVVLAIGLRLVLFSSIENPEPRYLVEFFPFLSILGGIAIGQFRPRMNADRRVSGKVISHKEAQRQET
jgi:hypothetical protein